MDAGKTSEEDEDKIHDHIGIIITVKVSFQNLLLLRKRKLLLSNLVVMESLLGHGRDVLAG